MFQLYYKILYGLFPLYKLFFTFLKKKTDQNFVTDLARFPKDKIFPFPQPSPILLYFIIQYVLKFTKKGHFSPCSYIMQQPEWASRKNKHKGIIMGKKTEVNHVLASAKVMKFLLTQSK